MGTHTVPGGNPSFSPHGAHLLVLICLCVEGYFKGYKNINVCRLFREQDWDSPKWWCNLLEGKLCLKWNYTFWNLKCILVFKLHFEFLQSCFFFFENRVYFWNQITFFSISAQQITLRLKWNHSLFFSLYRKSLAMASFVCLVFDWHSLMYQQLLHTGRLFQ